MKIGRIVAGVAAFGILGVVAPTGAAHADTSVSEGCALVNSDIWDGFGDGGGLHAEFFVGEQILVEAGDIGWYFSLGLLDDLSSSQEWDMVDGISPGTLTATIPADGVYSVGWGAITLGGGLPWSAQCIPADGDGDGVGDTDDVCPGTVLPESFPELRVNRFAANANGAFVDAAGTASGYTIVDTGGCSATQIIAAAALGSGHTRFGITRSALNAWVASHT